MNNSVGGAAGGGGAGGGAGVNLHLEVERALVGGFRTTDREFLQLMRDELAADPVPPVEGNNVAARDAALVREKNRAYSSSTCVAVLLVGTTLGVAHLGDSRACIGRPSMDRRGRFVDPDAFFLTNDHKPDSPGEKARIMAAGGTVVPLHGGRPYLRGGDFAELQQRGRRPMQLNYSRAFGGLNLKPYGLSSNPDFRAQEIDPAGCTVMVLASDGLWDIFQNAQDACCLALEEFVAGRDPSTALVNFAIEGAARNQMAGDNVTCTVLIFKAEE